MRLLKRGCCFHVVECRRKPTLHIARPIAGNHRACGQSVVGVKRIPAAAAHERIDAFAREQVIARAAARFERVVAEQARLQRLFRLAVADQRGAVPPRGGEVGHRASHLCQRIGAPGGDFNDVAAAAGEGEGGKGVELRAGEFDVARGVERLDVADGILRDIVVCLGIDDEHVGGGHGDVFAIDGDDCCGLPRRHGTRSTSHRVGDVGAGVIDVDHAARHRIRGAGGVQVGVVERDEGTRGQRVAEASEVSGQRVQGGYRVGKRNKIGCNIGQGDCQAIEQRQAVCLRGGVDRQCTHRRSLGIFQYNIRRRAIIAGCRARIGTEGNLTARTQIIQRLRQRAIGIVIVRHAFPWHVVVDVNGGL